MEVEDEDSILQRLFFKKYGRALPEPEKEKDEVDINFVIDLTDEKDEEMEVATSNVVPVVKTEPIEIANVNNVNSVTGVADVAKLRQERRELVKGRKALIAFGKTLRKSVQIPEKEAPKVSADSNVSEDTSVTTVNPESITTDEAIEMAEKAIAESDATIVANQQEFAAEFGDTPLDEFDDESEFRLFPDETDVINEDDDEMIDDI
jgi:dihydroorotase